MTAKVRDYVVLFINGQRHDIRGADAFMMLADFLRYQMKLTGTKIVCAEGDCGACTVLCYRHSESAQSVFLPQNACIITVAQLDGCHILTVEALTENGSLSAIQQAIVAAHGSQCGFCTPGFVMAMSAIFQTPHKPLCEQKVKNCLTGNLCRCTGYQSLIDAALAVPHSIKPLFERFSTAETDGALREAVAMPVHLVHDKYTMVAPLSLTDAHHWLKTLPAARVLAGATDFGVALNKGKAALCPMVSLHLIKELYDVIEENGRIMVGARVTLNSLRRFSKTLIPELASFLNIFGSPQIKNAATLVGNIANGSPIGDTLPFLMVCDGQVHVWGEQGERVMAMADVYRGYKTLALKPHEFISHASFAIPKKSHKLRLDKASQRKDLDISTVNSAFCFELDDVSSTVKEARIAFGGVQATVVRLKKTEVFLQGKVLSPHTIERASVILQKEVAPLSDLRGTSGYRRVLADGLFRRYCHQVKGNEDASP